MPRARRDGTIGTMCPVPDPDSSNAQAEILEPFQGETRICEIVFPEDTNPYGKMFGGRALQLMDKAAAVASMRFCHHTVVTACSDRVDFDHPIEEGSIIELVARVVFAGRSSMVIKVDLFAEGRVASRRQRCTTGYFTMVAVDDNLRPMEVVPPFEPTTEGGRAELEHARRLTRRPTRD